MREGHSIMNDVTERTLAGSECSPLGQHVLELRRARRWTQQGLAQKCGVTLSVITKLEQGLVGRPHRTTLRALARVFRLPLQQFFDLLEEGPLP